MISKTAEFTVKPEGLKRSLAAIEEFVSAVREKEPGTRLYVSLREAGEGLRFLHVMVFEDEEAERRHRSSGWVRRFTDLLYPETEVPPRFVDFDLVATTERGGADG